MALIPEYCIDEIALTSNGLSNVAVVDKVGVLISNLDTCLSACVMWVGGGRGGVRRRCPWFTLRNFNTTPSRELHNYSFSLGQ